VPRNPPYTCAPHGGLRMRLKESLLTPASTPRELAVPTHSWRSSQRNADREADIDGRVNQPDGCPAYACTEAAQRLLSFELRLRLAKVTSEVDHAAGMQVQRDVAAPVRPEK
jgi:hypothetical protein